MPLPLVHIIGTYPGCGATTITHLWGESADERPLDSPLPAKGSPWVVPVLMGHTNPCNKGSVTSSTCPLSHIFGWVESSFAPVRMEYP